MSEEYHKEKNENAKKYNRPQQKNHHSTEPAAKTKPPFRRGFSSTQPRHNYANGPLQTNDSFLLLRQGDIPACVTSCIPCAPRVPRAPRAPCVSCVRPAPRVRPTCAPPPVRVPRTTIGDDPIVFAPRNASSIFVFDPERGTVEEVGNFGTGSCKCW